MRWINTTFSMGFGGEDGGEELPARFTGVYYPKTNGCRYGAMVEPPEPASFLVYTVQISWDEGEHWTEVPSVLLTDRLVEQLKRIGIAEHEGEAERCVELAADARREEALLARPQQPAMPATIPDIPPAANDAAQAAGKVA